MGERTLQDLQMKQALPLSVKILLTKDRIRQWVNEFGEDGVYVSFSGGKDSTVLLHLVRELYPDVEGVFCDTGLEYPEIREFVKTFDNIIWLKPKMNFKQVIDKYGYPFISKEVSETIEEAKKYLTRYNAENTTLTDRQTDRQTGIPNAYAMADMLGIDRRINKNNQEYQMLKKGIIPSKYKFGKPTRVLQLEGKMPHKENGVFTDEYSKQYDKSRYRFLLDAPFDVSSKCCNVMKKQPMKEHIKETGKHPITAQMASESKLRTSTWIKQGCNAFNAKNPISNPMSFWTEQDVLLYIYQNHLPICSVYGEIVKDNDVDGQTDWEDLGLFDIGVPVLRTTGCNRTGCMFCGFGCHLEPEGQGRFEKMKVTHPKQYEWIMKPWDEGGLGYKDVIDWINEHNGKGRIIRY